MTYWPFACWDKKKGHTSPWGARQTRRLFRPALLSVDHRRVASEREGRESGAPSGDRISFRRPRERGPGAGRSCSRGWDGWRAPGSGRTGPQDQRPQGQSPQSLARGTQERAGGGGFQDRKVSGQFMLQHPGTGGGCGGGRVCEGTGGCSRGRWVPASESGTGVRPALPAEGGPGSLTHPKS